ncbi:hypothetical protein [Fibrobacter intestinalis]|uniref:Uncharacterized protein n=1 Tax=Fibrobacter intestinalis TaxID=28122 RepID=A0A1T4LL15_9BACT|nr:MULTISPECIES: hypothetical protein [Fibrobacter]PBC73929.1 hypothetical protein BGW94_1556 [Fibrobacter sp. NR9]SJZ55346.1 hypothetical protein SAMN02745108_00924 [Fibrobacter intestinalis]
MARKKNQETRLKHSTALSKEPEVLRNLRIRESQNGATLRTRIIDNKKQYNRKQKHKKSFASAEDFAFQMSLGLVLSRTKGRETRYVYFGKC